MSGRRSSGMGGADDEARHPESGVTLVEMLVALALFAMIGVAGFSVLDAVLRVQSGTEGRLSRIGQLDQSLRLLGRDLAQADPDQIRGSAGDLSLRAPGQISIRYGQIQPDLIRAVDRPGAAAPVVQALVPVEAVSWRYLGQDWSDQWPVPGLGPLRAVEVTLVAAEGRLWRIFEVVHP